MSEVGRDDIKRKRLRRQSRIETEMCQDTIGVHRDTNNKAMRFRIARGVEITTKTFFCVL